MRNKCEERNVEEKESRISNNPVGLFEQLAKPILVSRRVG